jgi:hypothetical protein
VAEVIHKRIAPASFLGVSALSKRLSQGGISSPENSRLIKHEEAHANQDTEGTGWYGVIIYNHPQYGEIIMGAFYEFEGARTPEARMRIASGPGFLAMSNQDWFVYYDAQRELTAIFHRHPDREPEPDEKSEDTDLTSRDTHIPRLSQPPATQPYEQLPLAT